MPSRPSPRFPSPRLAWITALALLGACGREAAGPLPAAVAGPDTLSPEALSNWMVLGQPLPVSVEVAEGLARHWTEVSALALLGPEGLRDPGFVDAVVWPRRQGMILDSVLSRRVPPPEPPSPGEVESVFRQGRLRLLARILRRASPEAHPEERQRQRDEAFDIHRSLTGGASWNEAVGRSEDLATRSEGGLLGLVGPGELEPGLERAAFALEPGAISPVVETRDGYQILFRPRLEDVRPLFARSLLERRAVLQRTAFLDSVVASRGPVAVEGAGARLLAWAAGDPPDGSGPPLARWEGGALSDSAAVRYLGTLSPADRDRLVRGPEGDAAELILEIAGQEILRQALTPAADSDATPWQGQAAAAAEGEWLATLDLLATALGLGADWSPEDRRRGVEGYMESVVSRRRAPVALPAPATGLATLASEARIDPDGLQAAVDRASRLLAGAQGGGP